MAQERSADTLVTARECVEVKVTLQAQLMLAKVLIGAWHGYILTNWLFAHCTRRHLYFNQHSNLNRYKRPSEENMSVESNGF